MSTKSNVEVNTRQLFQSRSIEEIKRVEQNTRSEIEDKKNELQKLIGNRYRDVIDSADYILGMTKSANQLRTQLHSSATLVRKLVVQPQPVKPKLDLYQFAKEIRHFVESPEEIWYRIETFDFVGASEVYVRAVHIYQKLITDKEVKENILKSLPLVEKQNEQLHNNFPHKILDNCRKRLLVIGLNPKDYASAMIPFLILSDIDATSLLEDFLKARYTILERILSNEMLNKTTVTQRVNALCNFIREYQLTIYYVGVLFMSSNFHGNEQNEDFESSRSPGINLFQGHVFSEVNNIKKKFEIISPSILKSVIPPTEEIVQEIMNKWILSTISKLIAVADSTDNANTNSITFSSTIGLFTTLTDLAVLQRSILTQIANPFQNPTEITNTNYPSWSVACLHVVNRNFDLWEESGVHRGIIKEAINIIKCTFNVLNLEQLIETSLSDLEKFNKPTEASNAQHNSSPIGHTEVSAHKFYFQEGHINQSVWLHDPDYELYGANGKLDLNDLSQPSHSSTTTSPTSPTAPIVLERDYIEKNRESARGVTIASNKIIQQIDLHLQAILNNINIFLRTTATNSINTTQIKESQEQALLLSPHIKKNDAKELHNALQITCINYIKKISQFLYDKIVLLSSSDSIVCILFLGRLGVTIITHSKYLQYILSKDFGSSTESAYFYNNYFNNANREPLSSTNLPTTSRNIPNKLLATAPRGGIEGDIGWNNSAFCSVEFVSECYKPYYLGFYEWTKQTTANFFELLKSKLQQQYLHNDWTNPACKKSWMTINVSNKQISDLTHQHQQHSESMSSGVVVEEHVPYEPSPFITALLFNICQKIENANGHLTNTAVIDFMVREISSGALSLFHAFLTHPNNKEIFTKEALIQLWFDIKYFQHILKFRPNMTDNPLLRIQQQQKEKIETTDEVIWSKKVESIDLALGSLLDPIDILFYSNPIKTNSLQAYLRSYQLFGQLTNGSSTGVPTNRSAIANIQAAVNPSVGTSNTHNLLTLVPLVPRFKLLPISEPSTSASVGTSPTNSFSPASSTSALLQSSESIPQQNSKQPNAGSGLSGTLWETLGGLWGGSQRT